MNAGIAGNYTINLKKIENIDNSVAVILEDCALGVFQNFRLDSTYTFSTDTANNLQRFFLHFNPPLEIEVKDGSCTDGGEITLNQPGGYSWNYMLADDKGNLVGSGLDLNGTVVLSDLPGSHYTLAITDSFGYQFTKEVESTESQQVTAGFDLPDSIVQAFVPISFANWSIGATNYEWSFGDGISIAGVINPDHIFTEPDRYIVKLVAYNAQCSDTFSQNILVVALATANNLANLSEDISVVNFNNEITISINLKEKTDSRIWIYDILGKKLAEFQVSGNGQFTCLLPYIASAYYIVKVSNNNGKQKIKKVLRTNL